VDEEELRRIKTILQAIGDFLLGRRKRKNRKEQKREMTDRTPQGVHSYGVQYHGGHQAYPGAAYPLDKPPVGTPAIPTPQTLEYKSPTKKALSRRPNPNNVLRFSPKAWAKFQWFRDRGDTEISGFGISKKEEPLYVMDFLTVLQKATSASIELDDVALNNFLKEMVETKGYHPSEVLRIWLHTHPGTSASPSGTDMDTFRNVFGGADWALMVILAKGGECKAKVRFNVGPACEIELKTSVDLNPPFDGINQEDYEAWEKEYDENIRVRSYSYAGGSQYSYSGGYGSGYEVRSEVQGFREAAASACKLSEQLEIPNYGGIYRLKSREIDPDWALVSGTVEQVLQVDQDAFHEVTVITDLGWYLFDARTRVTAVPGDDIDSVHDLADDTPLKKGDVAWKYDLKQDQLLPNKITVFAANGVIDLRDDDDTALIELGIDRSKPEQAGFTTKKEKEKGNGEKSTSADAQSTKKTEIIDTREVVAAAATSTEKKSEQPGFEPGAGAGSDAASGP